MQKDNFNFEFEDYDDISSSSTNNKDKYENVISSSKSAIDENYYTGKRSYRKKKHGLAKVINDRYYKIRKWWKCMKKGKRRLLTALISIVLVLVLFAGTLLIAFKYNYNKITEDPSELGFEDVIDKKVINIALFGLDSRNANGKTSFTGNSDSIMILSINTVSKKVKIISLMRDTLVPIERDSGLTYNKINSAYSWGGPELAIKTLNKNFGLDISEYATVNFYGMSEIIDAVGGIDATLTQDEVTARGENNHGINDMIQEICLYEDLDANDYYVTVSGEQHLNGIQAVAYARIRYCTNIWGTSNDYGRTDRQRYVMEQLFNKAKTLSKKEYVKLAKALIPCTETSLSYSEIMKIAFNVMFSSPTFEQYRIPQNSSDMNFLMTSPKGSFGSVVYFDLAYATKLIKAIIYDDMTIEEYVAQYGIEKNDWYSQRWSTNSGSGSKTYTSTPSTSSNNSSNSQTQSTSQATSSEGTDSSLSENTSSTESEDNTSVDSSSEDISSEEQGNEEESEEASSVEEIAYE